MPVAVVKNQASNLIEVTITGKVTVAEYAGFRQAALDQIARHGKVRVLMQVPSMDWPEPRVFWEDFKFGLRNIRNIEQAALVITPPLLRKTADRALALFGVPHRVFDSADAARAWLQGGPAQPARRRATNAPAP